MKPEELMIGDWVMVAECVADAHFIYYPDKVESIRDGLVGLESDELETIIERITPIPLTAEILEKNGFKECANGDWTNDNVDFILYIRKDGIFRIQNTNMILPYISSFQHALRLCGIDKEITI